MYCEHCGKANKENSVFCVYCGKELRAVKPQANVINFKQGYSQRVIKPVEQRRPHIILGILSILGVLLGLVYVVSPFLPYYEISLTGDTFSALNVAKAADSGAKIVNIFSKDYAETIKTFSIISYAAIGLTVVCFIASLSSLLSDRKNRFSSFWGRSIFTMIFGLTAIMSTGAVVETINKKFPITGLLNIDMITHAMYSELLLIIEAWGVLITLIMFLICKRAERKDAKKTVYYMAA